jgi:hypothetical protein
MKLRHATANGTPPAVEVPPPHVIEPTAVYTVAAARRALGLRPSTLKREYRQGRLRVARCAGKIFLLGEWLLEWLRAGEVRR